MASRYTVESNGDIALVGATAKSILSFISGANALHRVIELSVSFDGVTAGNEPVTVELCSSTMAVAGTSTAHTIVQSGGPARSVEGTARRNYTVEPTVLTVLKRWLVRPDGGLLILQFPLGREAEQIITADAHILRCTAPDAVNCQGYMEVEEG
jgi:hypothetical protein